MSRMAIIWQFVVQSSQSNKENLGKKIAGIHWKFNAYGGKYGHFQYSQLPWIYAAILMNAFSSPHEIELEFKA